jgi:DNA repair exonuclease SbcCD ATPase subunit
MKKSEFRTPLIQSGAILLAVILVFSLIPSGDSMTVGSIVGSAVGGFFKFLLFLVALGLGLGICIAVLVGIFFTGVALQNSEQASEMWAEFKVKLAGLVSQSESSCCAQSEKTVSEPAISQEEYDKMKSELSSLQQKNQKLQSDVVSLSADNDKFKQDIQGLSTMVEELKASEEKINETIAELTEKVEKEPDTGLQDQVTKLEEMYKATAASIEDLVGKLQALEEQEIQEADSKADLEGGIFSYIESEDDKDFFVLTVEEAVGKEMTYAQIDEFLTENLSAELDQIVKDHPSLTKDFIRSKRG